MKLMDARAPHKPQARTRFPAGWRGLLAGLAAAGVAAAGCHGGARPAAPAPASSATIARIYFWRARPGKLEEYSRYIREAAEPIDRAAQRQGAFLSVTTTQAPDTTYPWTHMRIFRLRDSAQLAGLAQALDAAGAALEPDGARRNARSAYNATLRDAVGQATVDLHDGELVAVPLPGYGGAPVREGWLDGAGGVRLFYRLVGSGADTLVFVHGGPGTGMREGYDFEELTARGHALLMYDQRGAGYSDLVSAAPRLGLADHVADLAAVVQHFRLGRAQLIGLSWGAAVAARFAAEHPDMVERVAFVSPISPTGALLAGRFAHLDTVGGRPSAGGLQGRLRAAAAPVPDSLIQKKCRADRTGLYRYGGAHAVAPRGDPCDYPAAVLRNRVLARAAGFSSLGADYDLRPALAQVRAPAVVLEGERSNVPLEATRAFAAALPNARLLLVPEAGHQAWLDRPDLFFPLLDDFLRGRATP